MVCGSYRAKLVSVCRFHSQCSGRGTWHSPFYDYAIGGSFLLTGTASTCDWTREADICERFWSLYQKLEPNHEIFKCFAGGSLDPRGTFPFAFHGDEGRGRRRLPFLVCNFHSLLGKGTQEQNGQPRPYLKLRMNFIGSSLVTRLLHSATPKKLHQKQHVFDSLMDNACEEAEFMVNTGVVQHYTGRKVRRLFGIVFHSHVVADNGYLKQHKFLYSVKYIYICIMGLFGLCGNSFRCYTFKP